MAIKDYSTTPDMNTTISGINIAEGCPPSGINNAIRQLMADVKAEKDARDAAQSIRDAAQSTRDAAQDEAISAAQSSVITLGTTLRDLIADVGGEAETAKNSVPTGTVIAFAANSEPPGGYLLCNGAAVSRTTYAALFAAIGSTYGAGDGSSTFNIPNLTDRFIQGSSTAGKAKAAGLPNISWQINGVVTTGATYSGATAVTNTYLNKIDTGSGYGDHISTIYGSAASSNDIYGKSSTVQPPAVTMRYYIKH